MYQAPDNFFGWPFENLGNTFASNWSFEGGIYIWAPGKDMYTLSHYRDNDDYYNREWKGTSATAPVITGIIALLKARNPSLTVSQIKTILKSRSYTYTDKYLAEPKTIIDSNNNTKSILSRLPSSNITLNVIDAYETIKNLQGTKIVESIEGILSGDENFPLLITEYRDYFFINSKL